MSRRKKNRYNKSRKTSKTNNLKNVSNTNNVTDSNENDEVVLETEKGMKVKPSDIQHMDPEVLDKIFNDKKFLKGMYRVLAPGEHIPNDIKEDRLRTYVIQEAYKKLEPYKRNLKDTVFTKLFKEKKYVLQLYKALHNDAAKPEEKDIKIVTITSMLVDAIYNDLGFLVGDLLIILVEAQSAWSDNIPFRMLLYIAQAYRDYVEEKGLDVHSSTKLQLPKPELYVIYTGEKDIDKTSITFSDTYFNGEDTAVELTVKIIRAGKEGDIISQYCGFTRVLKEQTKIYGRTRKAVLETIRICKDENLLREFFEEHEKEAGEIMFTLFNEEEARRVHDNTIRAEGRAEGEAKGRAEGAENAIVSNIKMLMSNMAWSIEKAFEALSIPTSEYDKYRTLVAKR